MQNLNIFGSKSSFFLRILLKVLEESINNSISFDANNNQFKNDILTIFEPNELV